MYSDLDVRLLLISGLSPSLYDLIEERMKNNASKILEANQEQLPINQVVVLSQ